MTNLIPIPVMEFSLGNEICLVLFCFFVFDHRLDVAVRVPEFRVICYLLDALKTSIRLILIH